MIKIDEHVFQGMQGDISVSKADSKYLTEATNIRITPRTDNDGFTITNEKGEVQLQLSEDFTNEPFLGSAVLNNYYILFTLGGIYRIDVSDPQIPVLKLFDNSDNNPLNFKIDKPIETLVVYEKSDVQKVYWVDGENQPRVINIAVNTPYTDSKIFDFVQELALNETITVEKVYDASGEFPSGIVQYAFSYYNKYGQESNIFYTTGLYYSSPSDRGGRPDEICKCGFKITVNNVDTRFDYLRIYSILRTSLQAEPQVKRVFDIDIKGITDTPNSVNYTDYNTLGEDMDSTELLYIGGESIIAGTLAQKDNTLFLGNIRRKYDSSLKLTDENKNTEQVLREVTLKSFGKGSFYPWMNSFDSSDSSTFKIGENYRLGIQLQNKTGKWSEPIYLKDITLQGWDNYSSLRPYIDGNVLHIPQIEYQLNNTDINNFINAGYVKIRPVIVFPKYEDRRILMQGILCPTLFNYKQRLKNSPFVQSSWFFRPMENWQGYHNSDTKYLEEVMSQHWRTVSDNEIQGTYYEGEGTTDLRDVEQHNAGSYGVELIDSVEEYLIDQQYLTMHSPDIEFQEALQNINDENWKLSIIGASLVTGSSSDITLQTSTPAFSSKYKGFIHKSFITKNNDKENACFSLTHACYEDAIINTKKDFEDSENSTTYKVYTWNKQGSLNNDILRASGTRTAVLSKKIISNEKVCNTNVWIEGNELYTLDISPIQVFNSNEITLTKIPINSRSLSYTPTYLGNVDYLKVPTKKYNIVSYDTGKLIDTSDDYESDFQEPVRIKSKSTPHIVFGLKGGYILPRSAGYNQIPDWYYNYVPAWYDNFGPGDGNKINDGENNTGGPIRLWAPNNNTSTPEELSANFDFTTQTGIDNFIRLWGCNRFTPQDAGMIANYPYIYGWNGGENSNHTMYKYAVTKNSELEVTGLTFVEVVNLVSGDYWKFDGTIFYHSYTGYYKYTESGDLRIMTYIGPTLSTDEEDTEEESASSSIQDYLVHQDDIERGLAGKLDGHSYFYIAELIRSFTGEEEEEFSNRVFGGKSLEALRNNLWIPAGEPVKLDNNGTTVDFTWGDTWYQRYDCLKTYPFTQEDENSVVDIVSFMCETRVNIDGRYDRNRGQQNNLTMTPQNFNLVNNVYSQKNNFFNYRILDKEDIDDIMPCTITWSKSKINGSDVDLWTNVTMASILDLDGDKGELTALKTYNSSIYAFQRKGISKILFNERVQIPTTDVPIEISNNYKVDGKVYISDIIGCQQKSSICNTPNGIYFVDMNNKDINLLSQDGIKSISRSLGFSTWMEKFTGSQFLDNWYIGVDGFKTFYDSKNKDVYFSTNDYCLGYSELLDQFVSFYPCYSNTVDIFNIGYDTYRTIATKTKIDDNDIYSTSLSKMFYGNYLQDFSIEFVSNQEFTTDKIFENLEVRADAEDNQSYKWSIFPFTHIKVYNEYQDTNDIPLTYSSSIRHTNANLRRKFRIWRIQIPRDYTNKRDRIRNTWCRIKLKRDVINSTSYKFRIHDVGVKYFQN